VRLVLVAALLVLSPALAQDETVKVPDAAKEWKWAEKQSSLEDEAKRLLPGFDVALVATESTSWPKPVALTIKKHDKMSLTIEVWEMQLNTSGVVRRTALARWKNTLFVAEYNPISSGCSIGAYSLETGAKLWDTGLEGLGPVSHSKYSNTVQLEVMGDVLVVRGYEAYGKYIECLAAKTGKAVYHEKLEK
jgi:hypothetical protein